MKRLLLCFILSLSFLVPKSAFASLPDGTIAPDWTLTDINGNVHHLYDYLNAGKHVILDFSATWCSPCWSYHNSGVLEDLYDAYGPNGTDEIMVFFLEAELNNNLDCLYGLPTCVGPNGGTQGNWVSGTPYPIIDLPNSAVNADYNITYFPTLYAISANGFTTWEVGQAPTSTWESWLFNSFSLLGNATVTDSPCPESGSIVLSATGGQGNISYEWSTGDSGTALYDIDAGVYSCTLSDFNGYFVEETYDVLGGSTGLPFEFSIVDSENILCFGDETGSISVDASGGNGGIYYTWSNGGSGDYQDNLYAGTYTITATDSYGCELILSQTLTSPSALGSTVNTENADCGAENGTVTIVSYGGVYPHSYEIDNFGFNYTGYFEDIAPGVYTYSITDDNNCVIYGEFEILSSDGPVAEASYNGLLSCANPEVTVSGDGSSEGNNITYTWSTVDGNIVSGENSQDAVVSAAGTYTLTVFDNDAGCSQTASVNVTGDFASPLATAAASGEITCAVTNVMIDGDGSSSGTEFSYTWSTTDGNIVSGGNSLIVEVDMPGTYVLTVNNSNNGCSTSIETTVTEDVEAPQITVNSGELTCSMQEIELCATVDGGASVVWQLPEGDVSGNCVTVTSAGDFVAKVTGTNGCENTATATVTLSADIPQIMAEPNDNLTCVLTSVMLTAILNGDPANYTIAWYKDNVQIASGILELEVTEAGTYTVVVSDENNGCSSTLAYNVEEIIELPVSGFTSEAANGVVMLNSTSSGSPSSYSWDFGNGTTSTEENPTIEYDQNGTYNVCLTVTNDCGEDTNCQEIQYITVLSAQILVSDASCSNSADGSYELMISGGSPDYTIAVTGVNGYASNMISDENLEAGEYQYSVTDSNGTQITGTFLITQPDAISTEATITDVTCFGEKDGSISLELTGGTGQLSIVWEDDSLDKTLSDLAAGTYSAVVTDENGCITTNVFTVNEPSEIVETAVNITDTAQNQDTGSITFNAEGGTGDLTYTWSNGATGNTIEGLASGDYTVEVTDENGCTKTFGPFTVKKVSGVRDIDEIERFTISPNPSTGIVNLNIEFSEYLDAKLVIKDVTGRKLIENNLINKKYDLRYDLSNYNPGLYLFSIVSEKGSQVKKLILVK